jgi:hypothetical protein
MNWVQGNRVRIRTDESSSAHRARAGMVVWIVSKVLEHKSLGFIHPQSDPDGTARQYEVLTSSGETLRIWGKSLESIESLPSAEAPAASVGR